MNFEIPEISDDVLERRANLVRPVIRNEKGLFYRDLKSCDLRKTAFMWEPKLEGEAINLVPYRTIITLHRWAYYGFFKPSIEEVLSQISEDDIDAGVIAFETNGPETAQDLNNHKDALDAGFHVAETILYKKADSGSSRG